MSAGDVYMSAGQGNTGIGKLFVGLKFACCVCAGGNARVADMGLARWLTPESMGVLTGETGTYLYMSPEMIRHELYNSRTDVFSWGVLLVELITQRPPYEDQHLTPIQASTPAASHMLGEYILGYRGVAVAA